MGIEVLATARYVSTSVPSAEIAAFQMASAASVRLASSRTGWLVAAAGHAEALGRLQAVRFPHAERPQSRNYPCLIAPGMAMDEDLAVVSLTDRKAGLAVVMRRAARHPAPASLATIKGLGEGLGTREVLACGSRQACPTHRSTSALAEVDARR